MPAWAVVLVVATLLIGAGWAGITLLLPGAKSAGDSKAETKMTKPGDAAKQAHPFARHLEVTGLRVVETPKQKLMVQMIVVNHSAARVSVSLALNTPAPALCAYPSHGTF
jgi:hypothetical protein